MSVPLFKPSIKRKDMDSVLSCLVSDRIGTSYISERLVDLFGEILGCSGGYAVRDYSSALDLVFRSLKLEKGSKILLSPLAPLIYLKKIESYGLEPVFCRIDTDSACMSAESIDKYRDEVDAAVVSHHLGIATPMDVFRDWNKPLIEDISQSLGAIWREKPVGSFGDYVISAMEQNNIITSGGGVALLCRDNQLNSLNETVKNFPGDSFLPDMNGSLALVQLDQLESFIKKREDLGTLFRSSVLRGKHRLLKQPDGGKRVWYSLPIVLNSPAREVSQYALKKNVETTLAFSGSILEATDDDGLCRNAKSLFMRTLLFPLYPMMGKQNSQQVNKVVLTLP